MLAALDGEKILVEQNEDDGHVGASVAGIGPILYPIW